MELSAIMALTDRFPNSEIVILSPFPEMDRPFYAPVRVEPCNRRQLIGASIDLIRALLWRGLPARLRKSCDFLISAASLRRVLESDVLIDLSGDMLTEDYGPHVAYSHYIPILRALILGKPYMICAQSIGPFSLTKPLARLLLKRADAITVRDSITYEYLQQLGINHDHIFETADLAVLLNSAPRKRADDILRQEEFQSDERPILGVSVSQLVEAKYRKSNVAAKTVDFVNLFADVIDRLITAYDMKVLFVPHVTGPSEEKDDRLIAKRVSQKVNRPESVFVLRGDYRPDELKAIIARTHIFCGTRMHANIAALSSLVPTVAISYSHKTPGIMASCGMADYVLPVEEITQSKLYTLIERAVVHRSQISNDLETQLDRVRQRALKNIEILAQLMIRNGVSIDEPPVWNLRRPESQ